MNYLEFVNKRKSFMINESISEKNLDKYVSLIDKLLHKHINNLVSLVSYFDTSVKDNEFLSKRFFVYSKNHTIDTVFQINWIKNSDDVNPYSIDFFSNADILFNGKAKSALTINTLGSSLIYFLPIIWTVVNKRDFNLSEREAIELGRTVFDKKIKESSYYVGALRYFIFEDDESVEVKQYKNIKHDMLMNAMAKRNNSKKDREYFDQLNQEYNEIKLAILRGAKTIGEIELAISRNTTVITKQSTNEIEAEKKVKDTVEDPNITFKKMEGYVKMVTKGINPSVILCGAPGVGKTYRVKKILEEANYKDGKNLFIIKGKCTPRSLYLALYNYKEKGNILLIDDADSLVGPKAPEDCINILKGALDSTSDKDGRLVSYGVGTKILDDDGNEVPKRFYYNGSVIIITNYNAGSLDTALRGRSYIQDIHFSVDNVLKIIEDLLPKLGDGRISMESKNKAYNYLKQLVDDGIDMEVSIRTFSICAQIFESMSDDEDLAKSMIKEQMKLQASRLKSKY